jgi:hypothetical protein
MVASSVENWDTMPIILVSVEWRLHRKAMVRSQVSCRHRLALEMQILQAIRLKKIICVVE